MEFLRWKGSWIGSLLAFGMVNWVVFGMYGLPMGPAAYAFLLMLGISLLYLAASFVRYRRKKKCLEILEQEILYGGDTEDFLEDRKGQDCFEQKYRSLLKEAEEKRKQEQENARQEQRKSREYYTRWNHQIKTPIAAIKLLLSEREPDIRSIRRELFRVEQYADMALQYQRMEGEENDLVLEKVSLKKVVRKTLKKLSSIFVHKRLQVVLGNLEKEVVTDEKWFCFILEQILTNAAKYTGETGRVEIGLEGEVLCIRDNGIGIKAEDLPRIFEWGYTGYNGRLDKKSTGIGLALTQKAVKMLQISISIESQPGKGTRVMLHLGQDGEFRE